MSPTEADPKLPSDIPTVELRGRRLWRILVPLLIVIGGFTVAVILLRTGPTAHRQTPVRRAQEVSIDTIHLSRQVILIEVMGIVRPAREVALQPRVSGPITDVSEAFIPGGHVVAGQELVRIDPTDYELVIRQRRGDVAKLSEAYLLEVGMQDVARREQEMSAESLPDQNVNLVRREPQLATARAALDAAESALERARLDLQRTSLRSPFDAVLKARHVDLGSYVSTSTPVATLVGTSTYWVEALVPTDQLRWLQIPGASARIVDEASWGPGAYRDGVVLQLAPDVEAQGRMARLLIAVEDPLGLASPAQPSLLLGTYVRIEIEGQALDGVAAIPREQLKEGRWVWVMDDGDRLDIRTVEVAYRGRHHVVVTHGLAEGDRVVSTDLSAPVAGTPLRVAQSPEATSP